VLFLHGYLSSKESFFYQTEALSAFRRTVAVDLPGFGRSPALTEAWSLDDYVNFTVSVIDNLCDGRADIVAHSFGARIAIKLAATHPDKVGRMILTGAAGLKPKPRLKVLLKSSLYRALKRVFPKKRQALEERFSSPDYLAAGPVLRESFKKIVSEHLDGVLDDIRCPVLLIFGREDGQTPLYMARRLNGGISGSGLFVMDGCGHFCFSDKPEIFNAAAVEFLKD